MGGHVTTHQSTRDPPMNPGTSWQHGDVGSIPANIAGVMTKHKDLLLTFPTKFKPDTFGPLEMYIEAKLKKRSLKMVQWHED